MYVQTTNLRCLPFQFNSILQPESRRMPSSSFTLELSFNWMEFTSIGCRGGQSCQRKIRNGWFEFYPSTSRGRFSRPRNWWLRRERRKPNLSGSRQGVPETWVGNGDGKREGEKKGFEIWTSLLILSAEKLVLKIVRRNKSCPALGRRGSER